MSQVNWQEILGSQVIIRYLLLRLLPAFLTLFVGRWLARRVRPTLRKALLRTAATPSLVNLTDTVVYYLILLSFLILSLSFLGVPSTTLLTIVGVVVVILGIALQNSLSNFAATVIFLLFKPFEVGDLIETGSVMGRVQEIQLFNTVLLAANNQVHTLPNSKIQSEGVTNFSTMDTLRVDLVFSISYSDDVEKARRVIAEVLAADGRVLPDPEPLIFVQELGESSVDVAVRPFVRGEDYWAFKFDVVGRVKQALEAAGLTIPFPQRDIYIKSEGPTRQDAAGQASTS